MFPGRAVAGTLTGRAMNRRSECRVEWWRCKEHRRLRGVWGWIWNLLVARF